MKATYLSDRLNPDRASVALYGNRIHIRSLSSPPDVGHIIRCINRLIGAQRSPEIVFRIEADFSVYANIVTPIVSTIEKLKQSGYKVRFENLPRSLAEIGFAGPTSVSSVDISKHPHIIQNIWTFSTSSEIQKFIDASIFYLSQTIACEQGVLTALDLAMAEIMDNVLQHSGAGRGFIMIQLHSASRKIGISVSDCGMGIFKSLRSGKHRPNNHEHAIKLAIQKGITRDEKIGRGNGLWILAETIKYNGGQYTIQSGNAAVFYQSANAQPSRTLTVQSLEEREESTYIDFQVSTSKKILLKDILKDQIHVDLRLESFEDEYGNHVIYARNLPSGIATREGGASARLLASNLLADGINHITFDFGGIKMISASFADEVFGHLVDQFGHPEMKRLIRVQNANQDIRYMIERAIGIRKK